MNKKDKCTCVEDFIKEPDHIAYDPDEVKKGMEVEREHIKKDKQDTPEGIKIREKIAKHHMGEFKNSCGKYYEELGSMERELEKYRCK